MPEFLLPKGVAREGKLAGITKFILAMSPGKALKITVAEHRSSRSDQQNAYLWRCYEIFGNHLGYDKDEMHVVLLERYFGTVEKKVPRSKNHPDGIKHVPRRTTTHDENGKRDVLAWDAFADYVAFVQRLAARNGCFIPDPNPDWREVEQQEAEAA
jgi:hypothetical protein